MRKFFVFFVLFVFLVSSVPVYADTASSSALDVSRETFYLEDGSSVSISFLDEGVPYADRAVSIPQNARTVEITYTTTIRSSKEYKVIADQSVPSGKSIGIYVQDGNNNSFSQDWLRNSFAWQSRTNRYLVPFFTVVSQTISATKVISPQTGNEYNVVLDNIGSYSVGITSGIPSDISSNWSYATVNDFFNERFYTFLKLRLNSDLPVNTTFYIQYTTSVTYRTEFMFDVGDVISAVNNMSSSLFDGLVEIHILLDTKLDNIYTFLGSMLAQQEKTEATLKAIIANQTQSINNKLDQVISAINGSGGGGGIGGVITAINDLRNDTQSQTTSITNKLGEVITEAKKDTTVLEGAISAVESSVDIVNNTLNELRQQEIQEANKASGDIGDFFGNMQNSANEKFAPLFYPIDIMRQFVDIIGGGTQSASYTDIYSGVTGWRYDDDTGNLVPIVEMTADGFPTIDGAVEGTVFTFPSFVLSIPNVGSYTLWESYQYDLASVKEQFPVLFDAIYIFFGVILFFWFVDFLVDLFEEVFRN